MRIEAEPTILAQLQALADPTRARLLLALERHELTVGELCQLLQLPQSTVSRHLKTLADEGWLVVRADGASRRYSLAALDESREALWRLVRAPVEATVAARQDALRIPAVLAQRRTASAHFFAGVAGHWDSLRTELFGDRVDLLALLALLDDGWTVGDLGCGTGQLAAALAPFVRRVVAVDASAAMLDAARLRLADTPNVELRAGELEALPVADGEIDVALLALVLHHAAEPTAVLAEARRALAPGGRLLIVDMLPHAHAEYRQTMGHVWQGFEAGQLHSWMGAAGFVSPRLLPLPPDANARGPALFVATARVAAGRTTAESVTAAGGGVARAGSSAAGRARPPEGQWGAPPEKHATDADPLPPHPSLASRTIPSR
ncbi:MAG: ArsR/SmtB family transcription factor [Gemmatimonadaceae bacterium]